MLELHKSKYINKLWSYLTKRFTISVVLIPGVHSQMCARYVNSLPKYELSKFDTIKILNKCSTTLFDKILVNNNFLLLHAYEILINYYTIKCTTTYISTVNKTKIISFFCEFVNFP